VAKLEKIFTYIIWYMSYTATSYLPWCANAKILIVWDDVIAEDTPIDYKVDYTLKEPQFTVMTAVLHRGHQKVINFPLCPPPWVLHVCI
jgi:hypothetical protein